MTMSAPADDDAPTATRTTATTAKEDDQNQDDEANLWYLAIGSMMLPASYQLRNFHPAESMAAELLDYQLGFFGAMGFAEAIPAPGKSLHGVMHRVTAAQMHELDKIEVGYVRRSGQARPYGKTDATTTSCDNGLVAVTVYCRPEGANKPTENKPPRQRYLEILIAGAEHYQLDPTYIEFLKQHPFQPRTPPDEFLSFDICDTTNSIVYTQVPPPPQQGDGNLVLVLNGKVIETSYPPDHPHGSFYQHLVAQHGPHFEIGMSRLALDLNHGVVDDMQQCTPEHQARLEDGQYRFVKHADELQYWKVIGIFDYGRRSCH